MNLATISPLLFLLGAFTLATVLEPKWSGMQRQQARSVIDLLVGDGKRLFADYFVQKADVYFHNGYYPSIFDQLPNKGGSHLTESANAHHAGETPEEHAAHAGKEDEHDDHDEKRHEAEMNFLGDSRDFIEAFGRNFFISKHAHMKNAESKELLPWFKISAELDPHRVETYTVAAFWLRSSLKKVDEAEEFLREGWKENPESYAILLELGKLYEADRQDYDRARNVWELALKKWDAQERGKEHPDLFAREQILAHLVELEAQHGDLSRCLAYLRQLEPLSPHPETIRKHIADIQAKLAKQPN